MAGATFDCPDLAIFLVLNALGLTATSQGFGYQTAVISPFHVEALAAGKVDVRRCLIQRQTIWAGTARRRYKTRYT